MKVKIGAPRVMGQSLFAHTASIETMLSTFSFRSVRTPTRTDQGYILNPPQGCSLSGDLVQARSRAAPFTCQRLLTTVECLAGRAATNAGNTTGCVLPQTACERMVQLWFVHPDNRSARGTRGASRSDRSKGRQTGDPLARPTTVVPGSPCRTLHPGLARSAATPQNATSPNPAPRSDVSVRQTLPRRSG